MSNIKHVAAKHMLIDAGCTLSEPIGKFIVNVVGLVLRTARVIME